MELLEYLFFRNALIGTLLACITCGIVGTYIVSRRLLFIIPGIIAGYSYAMTSYILAENPELTASEAIERSKQMMSGNR